MSEPAIHIHHLRKAFGPKLVLEQPELRLAPGVHFMIGPNGSGKTTLFKCLAGMQPFEGKVILKGGIDLQRDRMAHRRAVSMCAAEPQFPEYLRGTELLEFVLRTRGLDMQAATPIIEALGMAHFLNEKVGIYSSGMKKKLGLLMGMAGFPPVILLDEPYSALDQPSRRSLAVLIRSGVERGCTFLIASHLADLHAAFGDGTIYLFDNKQFRPLAKDEALPWLEQNAESTEMEEAV